MTVGVPIAARISDPKKFYLWNFLMNDYDYGCLNDLYFEYDFHFSRPPSCISVKMSTQFS